MYIGDTSRNLRTRPAEHKRAKGDVNNHIAEQHRFANHTINCGSTQCLTYCINYFQRLTLVSWFTNLEQTPLNRCQLLPAPYKRAVFITNIANRPGHSERPNFNIGSKLTNHDQLTPLESYSQ